MSARPFITIVIPTYNSEKEISGILQSIKDQRFTDYEIIIVDGSSKDATLKKIKAIYSENNIKVLSEPDKGLYDAMNKGINLSQGKYICFLGADDFIRKHTFELVKKTASNKKADMIYGLAKNNLQNRIYGTNYSLEKLTTPGRVIPHGSVFYHRALITKVGFFDLECPVAADVIFNIKAFSLAQKPTFIDKEFYFFSGEGISKDTIDTNFYKKINRILEDLKINKSKNIQRKLFLNQNFYNAINKIIFKNWLSGFINILYLSIANNNYSAFKHALYHIRIRIFNTRKFI